MEKEEISKKAEEKEKSNASYAGAVPLKKEEGLQKMILDTVGNKYDIIFLARRWAYELQSQDASSLPVQDLITQALEDILSGRVSPKTIQDLPPFRVVKKQKSPAKSLLDVAMKPVQGTAPSTEPEKTSSASPADKK